VRIASDVGVEPALGIRSLDPEGSVPLRNPDAGRALDARRAARQQDDDLPALGGDDRDADHHGGEHDGRDQDGAKQSGHRRSGPPAAEPVFSARGSVVSIARETA